MLRIIGVSLLMIGSIGTGWTIKEKMKKNLDSLYCMKQILQMFQNEMAYSKSPLPEACTEIGNRVEEPYRSAFFSIKEEMLANRGEPFLNVWQKQMQLCMKELPISKEDISVFLDFGGCIGYMDGKIQAEAINQHIHKLDISIGRMEKDMANKCKVIMSLSIMGGLMLVIILL